MLSLVNVLNYFIRIDECSSQIVQGKGRRDSEHKSIFCRSNRVHSQRSRQQRKRASSLVSLINAMRLLAFNN